MLEVPDGKKFVDAYSHPNNKSMEVDDTHAHIHLPSGSRISMSHEQMSKLMKRPMAHEAILKMMNGKHSPQDVSRLLMELQRQEVNGAK